MKPKAKSLPPVGAESGAIHTDETSNGVFGNDPYIEVETISVVG